MVALYSFQDQKFFLRVIWMLEWRLGFPYAHPA